ncbi:hypothetical protein [Methylomonas koyamae]|uniref:hypothetical protein n=1 Tax=Methylomonas koyamae TaxID=702114 RepID=UPI0028739B13|nr:hypothetical protein [Methylomonas koyamae]WNB77075.1 hypothetical protein RI210_05765 [Methylomonas koyamae]
MAIETKTPYEIKRDEYMDLFKPLFLPEDPVSNDIIRYFASLLRALGMEDHGWDPYAESRAMLNDINGFFFVELPTEHFNDPERTHWRLGLILYSHILEMDAPYEVITNLLRFKLGKGYSPNPFFHFLTEKEKTGFQKKGIGTIRKIEIIKKLSDESGSGLAGIFDEFYSNKLRNAIAHADFILTDDDFRCRGDISGIKGFRLSYEELDWKIMCAKAFVSAFFQIELLARQVWGREKQKAIPYDPHYKGLMEVLVDDQDIMCGFRVHWPNNSESTYRRTEDGVEMTNCSLDLKNATLGLFVNLYAQKPGTFSPLVEHDSSPVYTKLEGCDEALSWPRIGPSNL